MNDYWSILLISGAAVAAVIVLLTAEPKVSKRLTAIAGALALVCGLLVYGCGYIPRCEDYLQTGLRTMFSVCRMFIGDSDFGEIEDTALFSQYPWIITVSWCAHVLAFYATSSAAISLIGANALRKLRVYLSQRKDLSIIYGVNEDSVSFGQALAENCGELTVYVTEDSDAQLADAVIESGGVLRNDARAVSGSRQFLKSLGIRRGKRKITLYALSKDQLKNQEYAEAMRDAFMQQRVRPEQISLVIHTKTDQAAKQLQIGEDGRGFGFVTAIQEADLTARLLILKHPPCSTMTFDKSGCAVEDFEAIVIGFGKIGQTVLRNIIMNSQFIGNNFRADVFEQDLNQHSGFFKSMYQGIFDHYQVKLHDHDGRSDEIYGHLKARLDKIKYVAVCTDSEELNEEIAAELCAFFARNGRAIAIHQCSNRGVKTTDSITLKSTVHNIYHPDVLSTKKLDAMAMAVNRFYMGDSSKGALKDWMNCDYFSRMSNRAFADSIQAVLAAANRSEQQALEGQWTFCADLMENLGRMEHARWNAFHFCMGFMPMSEAEYTQRAEIYKEQVAQGVERKIRIGKNLDAKTHACLISWDALDDLSTRENEITGGKVNYKQMDRDNIAIVPKLYEIQNSINKLTD